MLVSPCLRLFPYSAHVRFVHISHSFTIIFSSASSSCFTLAVPMRNVSRAGYTSRAWDPRSLSSMLSGPLHIEAKWLNCRCVAIDCPLGRSQHKCVAMCCDLCEHTVNTWPVAMCCHLCQHTVNTLCMLLVTTRNCASSVCTYYIYCMFRGINMVWNIFSIQHGHRQHLTCLLCRLNKI